MDSFTFISFDFFEDLDFYGEDVGLLVSCLVAGLRVALLLICIEFTNFVLHSTYTRTLRIPYVVVLF